MTALFLLGCLLAGLAGGYGVDTWIRRAARRERACREVVAVPAPAAAAAAFSGDAGSVVTPVPTDRVTTGTVTTGTVTTGTVTTGTVTTGTVTTGTADRVPTGTGTGGYGRTGGDSGAGTGAYLMSGYEVAGADPGRPLDRHLRAHRHGWLYVPVLAGLGCLAAGLRFGPGARVLPFLFLLPLLAGLAVVDLHTHRLPNALTLPAYPVGVLLIGAIALSRGEPLILVDAVLAAVLLFVVFLVLALLRPSGMGMGDVKAAGVIGLFVGALGVGAALVAAFTGALLGLLGGLLLIGTGRIGRRQATPFGPWLALGALVGVLAGPALFSAYLAGIQ